MSQRIHLAVQGYTVRLTCVDIQRKPSVDLAPSKQRKQFRDRIRAKEFDAILLSPPCSTFSRAPWKNFKGPRPVLRKFMTSKFPATLVLMELAEELSFRHCKLKFQWIKRDINQLADDLTNGKFDAFGSDLRVNLKGGELEWQVLDKLLKGADTFL